MGKNIEINPELRTVNLGNQKMLVLGEFKQIMLLNQPSNRIMELLYQERNINCAKERWLNEVNIQIAEKEIAEHDFNELVDGLIKNHYIKEINE